MAKISCKVMIKNDLGLHIRPATAIVKMLQKTQASVFFTCKNETVNARSIMSILMLMAKKKSKIMITVDGSDAEKTMQMLVQAFDHRFGEQT